MRVLPNFVPSETIFHRAYIAGISNIGPIFWNSPPYVSHQKHLLKRPLSIALWHHNMQVYYTLIQWWQIQMYDNLSGKNLKKYCLVLHFRRRSLDVFSIWKSLRCPSAFSVRTKPAWTTIRYLWLSVTKIRLKTTERVGSIGRFGTLVDDPSRSAVDLSPAPTVR